MTTQEYDERRLCEAFRNERGIALDGRECPAAETLWAAAHGELDRTRLEEVMLHGAGCPACAEGWRLAYSQATQLGQSVHATDRRGSWWRSRPLHLAAAAVMIAVALGIGYNTLLEHEPPTANYRFLESSWLQSGIPADEALARSACLLFWTHGPEGTTYDVLVSTDLLEPLVEVWRVDKPELLIDQKLLADLPPGSTLFWRITAHPPDGGRISSRTFRTRIK